MDEKPDTVALNHRRYNPLLDEWVIVAANRINRPWQGAKETAVTAIVPSGASEHHEKTATTTEGLPDVTNALAPKGLRANGERTPEYRETFVFTNDFPSLTDDGTPALAESGSEEAKNLDETGLFRMQTIRGTCRVICYHPDSRLSMAQMSQEQIEHVIDTWIEQINELQNRYTWIQIFENKGAMVGCSNPHPHGQLWASDFLPNMPAKKYATQKAYNKKTGRIMLMDVVKQELKCRERIVCENDYWLIVVPYWAYWPFETMILPKRPVNALNAICKDEKSSLARIIKVLLVKYDNLFQCSFPFSMGWYGAPTGRYLNQDLSFWILHAVYLPPLLRSATVKKFMAGYELLSEPQRDITPEKAAEMLRVQSEVHYTEKF